MIANIYFSVKIENGKYGDDEAWIWVVVSNYIKCHHSIINRCRFYHKVTFKAQFVTLISKERRNPCKIFFVLFLVIRSLNFSKCESTFFFCRFLTFCTANGIHLENCVWFCQKSTRRNEEENWLWWINKNVADLADGVFFMYSSCFFLSARFLAYKSLKWMSGSHDNLTSILLYSKTQKEF